MVDERRDPTVGELSEGRILRGILERLGESNALVGPGDDAAVIAAADGRVVATVDTLVHGPDFRLAWSSAFDLGYKAAAVNLADVAAMGATPTALLVALAMPDATRLSFVTGIADGLRAACRDLAPGCRVEGGDLTVSDTLTIAVTALGALAGRDPVLRSGAEEGDLVAVAGELGRASRGLDILFQRFTDAAGHPIPVDESLLDQAELADLAAQLRPSPPVWLGPEAADAGATAMMDVSDGLVLDASRMAAASAVTIAFESASLGADVASALAGGEDHALLATFPANRPLPRGFVRVGMVRPRGDHAVLVDGRPHDGRGGWDPYRDWDAGTG
ncbi:thiamine-phosphate kinase [Microbacterium trichothecenolyticum]|uniref:Thiamine-monophosphate kinase n=1 Tax=Microbacterium ureisolvens TaxID=2781186 RepID=A0ABS7HSM7_9MICO|nr:MULTISPECIES: thiamine-phosphate kinase [Microbacterium]MBW9108324.1 thiamine-phosphate kinase [Microbacterium ureisolvens]MBW9118649.1 thiamine-phosphate kinase [Microbacterium trichothecenolyticum]